jgi:ParB family protein of integrating conjugative element (PFGI_1 class)
MSKRPPSDNALRSMLGVGHFGADRGPLQPSDPLTRTTIHQVPIDQIELYDRNPRRARNPNYAEIKESIRASGVLQNPKITRRPGAARYMLAFGGNTRLAILRELHAETGDPRFAVVDCDFVPWSSEAAVLVGHLIENETRGELSFIDKARGVREARLLLEAERGQPLSQRQLAEALRERGFRVDSPMIARYDYAIDVLAEALPQALNAGLGRPQVTRLRQLDTAAQTLWRNRSLGTDAIYRAVFCEALAATDEEDWSFDRARRSVESAIAQRAGIEPRLITLEMGAELDGSRADEDAAVTATPASRPMENIRRIAQPATSPTGSATARPRPSALERPPADDRHAAKREPGATSPQPPAQPAPRAERDPAAAVDRTLRGLRQTLYEAGQRYAQLASLDRCLRIDDETTQGCGYLVIDFPDPARCAAARATDASRQALAWSFWTLAQCCDLFSFVERRILDRHDSVGERERACVACFGAHSGFVRAWRDEGSAQEVVDETVGNADAYGYGDYVDAATDELWAADLALRQAYRELRVALRRAGVDSWSEGKEGSA